MDCLIKVAWSKFDVKLLLDNPGRNCIFIFCKNSFKNKQLKFSIADPFLCSAASVVEKTRFSGLDSDLYEVTPLKPLIHPVRVESVLPV